MTNDWEKPEQLSAYLDGELSESERAEVERLIEADPQARRLLDELGMTSRLVGGLERGVAPPGFAEAVQARLERRALLGDSPQDFEQGRTPAGRWVRRFAVAACLALACTAAWFGWRAERRPGDREPSFVVTDSAIPASTAREQALASRDATAGLDLKMEGAKIGETEMRLKEAPAQPSSPVAMQPAERRLSTLGYVASDALKPRESLESDDGRADQVAPEADFEKRLALGVLTNSEIRSASPGAFANQIEVEAADPADVSKIVSDIEQQMNLNAIPNAAAQDLPEPIAATQGFYAVQPPQTAQAQHADFFTDQAGLGRQVQIVMNVPTEVAVRAVQTLHESVDPGRVAVAWRSGRFEEQSRTFSYAESAATPPPHGEPTAGMIRTPVAERLGAAAPPPASGPGGEKVSASAVDARRSGGSLGDDHDLRKDVEQSKTDPDSRGQPESNTQTGQTTTSAPGEWPAVREKIGKEAVTGARPADGDDQLIGPTIADPDSPAQIAQSALTVNVPMFKGRRISLDNRAELVADLLRRSQRSADQGDFVTLSLTLRSTPPGAGQMGQGFGQPGQPVMQPQNKLPPTRASARPAPPGTTQPTTQGAGRG